MQPDRFEADLRATLHADADSMKTTMTAVELRRRAAARRTWGNLRMYPRLLFGAMVPVAVAVVLAVIVVLNPRTPTPIASAPPSILPSSGPSASPTIGPSPAAVPFDAGASGSLLVARAVDDHIELMSIDPSGAERFLAIVPIGPTDVESADWHVTDRTRPAIAFSDGHLVVRVIRELDPSESGNAWFDLRSPLEPLLILPAGAATFAPDGTLVIVAAGPGGTTEIQRYTDPTTQAARTTTLPDRVSLVTGRGGEFEIAANGTGVFADRLEADDTTTTHVILRWDGSVVESDGTQPDLTAGLARLNGTGGEQINVVCVDAPVGSSCGYDVQGPRGDKSIKVLGGDATDAAWTVDGDAVIAIDARGRVIRWTPTGSTLVGSLPTSGRIVGVTRDAVYVDMADEGTVTRLPLINGSTPSTTGGVFIRVLP